jgi:integral membrane sensor signal transduction histidine kinase
MIAKLRKKFILVIMLCVMSTISIALGSLFVINYISYKRNVNNFLERELDMYSGFREERLPDKNRREDNDIFSFNMFDDKPMPFLPSVCITLDYSGSVIESKINYLELSDEDIDKLANTIVTSKQKRGSVSSFGLEYLSITEDNYTYIVAADNSFESGNIRNLFILCIISFMISFFVFFAISVLLSTWILKPVEKSWQQQNRFVSDASHELRTPITVILANLNILSSKKDDLIKTQYQWIDNTKEEANRMKQLVDELLFLARSDDRQNKLVFSKIDLSELLLSRMLSFEALAFEKGIRLDYEIADGLYIIGHEGNVKQLLSILLDNAMKYCGDNGSVYLKAFSLKDRTYVLVKNSGDLIDAEDLKHIFERFYRTDKSRSRTEGGYGLGLAIAKTIVDNMHGKISVLSDKENGTVFKLELLN